MADLRDLKFRFNTARKPFATDDLIATPESASATAAAMATALRGIPAIPTGLRRR